MPAAGYELRTIAVEGLSRTNPLRAARAALKAAGAVRAAGRILDELQPRAVLGGGRLRRRAGRAGRGPAPHPARADRGRQPPRADQPPAGPLRRARVPRLPDRRTRGRALPRHRPPRARAGDRPHRRRASASAWRRRSAACSCSAARSARARSTRRRSPPSPTRRPRVLHAAGRRDLESLRPRVPGPHYDLRAYITPFGDALAAADLCVARAGGCIFEVAAHGRPAILVPYPARRRRPPDGQRALGWPPRARRSSLPDAELTPAAPAPRGRRAARRRGAPGRDGRGGGGAGAARRRRGTSPASCGRPPRRAGPACAGRALGDREQDADDHRGEHDERRGQGAPSGGRGAARRL